MSSIRNLEDIEARLAEITAEQTAHEARDFDSELAKAMTEGGDIDALEQQHLDAERIARRLRVERQALEAALPTARIERARRELAPLKQKHSKAVKAAVAAATKADAAWRDLQSAIAEFSTARQDAQAASSQERAMLTQMGADDTFPERLGVLTSARLETIAGEMLGFAHQVAELGRIAPGMAMGGVQRHPVEIVESEQ